jgi:tRNA(fMet)-specific endonuclease VapC
MFVLDTNVVIHYLKGKGNVRDRLLATPPSKIAIPAIVVYEVEMGLAGAAEPTQRQRQIAALFGAVTILPFDEAAAKQAAQIGFTLSRAGLSIGPMDTLIAGTALVHHATLVTHNTVEFQRVSGLALVDWF